MSAPAAPAEDGRPQAPALGVLFLIAFINLVGFGLVVPLLPFFGESLRADAWQIGIMFSAYSLGQFFAEPFWGRLSDRIGRKPVLLITLLANCAGYIALAFAGNIWIAILIRLFTGMGAGNISTIQGYVADVTPPEKRAGRMGLIGAAFGLGFIFGPGLGGVLAQIGDGAGRFQLPIFAAAGMAALAALGVILFLRESRERDDPATPRPSFLSGLEDARDNPVVSRALLVTLIYMAGFAGMEATFGLWTAARYGWTELEVGLAFMVVGVVSAVSQGVLTGRLARRFGEARVLAFGMLLFGASLAVQVYTPAAWTPALDLALPWGGMLHVSRGWLVAVVMVFGAFGMSLAMPNISAMISRSVEPRRQGAMLGLNMAAGSAARVIAPAAAGLVYSALGHDWPFLIGALLTVPAAIMAVNAGRAFHRMHHQSPLVQ